MRSAYLQADIGRFAGCVSMFIMLLFSLQAHRRHLTAYSGLAPPYLHNTAAHRHSDNTLHLQACVCSLVSQGGFMMPMQLDKTVECCMMLGSWQADAQEAHSSPFDSLCLRLTSEVTLTSTCLYSDTLQTCTLLRKCEQCNEMRAAGGGLKASCGEQTIYLRSYRRVRKYARKSTMHPCVIAGNVRPDLAPNRAW